MSAAADMNGRNGTAVNGILVCISAVCLNQTAYAICKLRDGELVGIIIRNIQSTDGLNMIEGSAYEFRGSLVSIRGCLSPSNEVQDKYCDYSFNISCTRSSIRLAEWIGPTVPKPSDVDWMYGLGSTCTGTSHRQGDLSTVSSMYFNVCGFVADIFKHGWMLVQLTESPCVSQSTFGATAGGDPVPVLRDLVLPHQWPSSGKHRYCFVSVNYYTGRVKRTGSSQVYSCADVEVGDRVVVCRVLPVVIWGEVHGFAAIARTVFELVGGKADSTSESANRRGTSGGGGGLKLTIPRQFYTANHAYVVWWALTYEAVKRCLASDVGQLGEATEAAGKRIRKWIFAILDALSSWVSSTVGVSGCTADINVPARFQVQKEHRSEISEFFQPHFASLFSVRSGLDADFLSQFLPQCLSTKDVTDMLSRYAMSEVKRGTNAGTECHHSVLHVGDLFTELTPGSAGPADRHRFIIGSVREAVLLECCTESCRHTLVVVLADRHGHALLCVMQFDGNTLPAEDPGEVRQRVLATVAKLITSPTSCFVVVKDAIMGVDMLVGANRANSRACNNGVYLVCDLRHVTVVPSRAGDISQGTFDTGTQLGSIEAMWNRWYHVDKEPSSTSRRQQPTSRSWHLERVGHDKLPSTSIFAALSVRDVLMLPEAAADPLIAIPEIVGCVAHKYEQNNAKFSSRRQVRIVLSETPPGRSICSEDPQSVSADEISLYLDADRPVVGTSPTLMPDNIAIGMTVAVRGCCLHLSNSKKFVYLAPPKDQHAARGFSVVCVGFIPRCRWNWLRQPLVREEPRRSVYNQRTSVSGQQNYSAPHCSISSLVDSRSNNRCIWTIIARISYIRSVSLSVRCEVCRSTQVNTTSVNESIQQYTSLGGGADIAYPEYYRYANRAFDQSEQLYQATTRRYGLELSLEAPQPTQCFCRKCDGYAATEVCWECTAVIDDGSSEAHIVLDSKDAILLLLGIQKMAQTAGEAPRYISPLTEEKYRYLVAQLEQEAWQTGSVNYDSYRAFSKDVLEAREFPGAVAGGSDSSSHSCGAKRQRCSDEPAPRPISKASALLHSYILEYFADHRRENTGGLQCNDRIGTPKMRKGSPKVFKFTTRIIVTAAKSSSTQQRSLRLQRVNTHAPFSVDHVEHQTLCTHQLLLQGISMSPWGRCGGEPTFNRSDACSQAATGPAPSGQDITNLTWNLLHNLNV